MSRPTFTSGIAITPSDTDKFQQVRALWIGTSGNLTVTMAGGGNAKVTLNSVPVGLLDIAVIQVWATGTAASTIVGLR